MKIKWEKVEDKIYKKNFHLCYGGTSQDFIKFIEHHHKVMSKDWRKVLMRAKGCVYSHQNYHYIWVHQKEKYDNVMAIYMHELFHYVMGKLPDCMLNYHDKTEEAYAYYFEYLFEEVEKALIKMKVIHR